MPNTALVTGASSGIGREFARYHAEKGGDLIITARRAAELEALKSEIEADHDVKVQTIALDLGSPEGAQELYDQTKGQEISILINNAGFGGHGAFTDRELASDLAMIDLNVKALVTLTHLVARDMAKRGSGKILNVSSTASYMPGPLQATYFATKAFVSSFSQALAGELKEKGITVTALEPGYVETEFAARADLDGTDLTKSGATPRSVAKYGYDAMRRGELRAINDGRLRFMLNWIVPWLPRWTVLKMVRRMQEKAA
ncbi:SDR family oxidoreductase [Cognatiyoonia sp. IB215446]|uniref:SDR family NAD(P)-dependent oxidoreductase n=1 Tax=Cognatiyoonia sp. IB215446 TaxID=3097355 RepID=UPI002A115AE8|nr:SDR family oxidoreductase [Cognatiyoonia sp. IB215446]MDX8348157.1 SDR family oxidoreductase [Cognatiyoonia sp. IB215446]